MKHNLIEGNTLTVTGKSLGENLDRWVEKYGELSETGQDVIKPLGNPLKGTGHIRLVLFGYISDVRWHRGNRLSPLIYDGTKLCSFTAFFVGTLRQVAQCLRSLAKKDSHLRAWQESLTEKSNSLRR